MSIPPSTCFFCPITLLHGCGLSIVDYILSLIQVLEVFGDPAQPAEPSPSCSSPRSPVSSWQRLADGVWVFGAHCSTGACSSVTAVGLLTAPAAGDLQCALWYEGSRHQLQGILSVNTDNLNITTFTCESKYPDKRPYSLAVFSGKGMVQLRRAYHMRYE